MDVLGKYGLGTTKEVTVEDVRGKLARTLELIRDLVPPEYATPLITAMRPVWSGNGS
jgi:hypothetical protein